MTRTEPNDCSTSPTRRALEHVDDRDVGHVAGLRVEVGVGRLHGSDARDEVELLHEELLAEVQVDRARVQGRVGAMLVGRAEQLTGVVDHDRVDVAAAGAHVDGSVGRVLAAVVPGVATPHELAALGHRLDRGAHLGAVAEERELVVAKGHFPRGAAKMRLADVRVRRVDHRGLGRLVEQVPRMVHEVLVERIVLGDEHGERVGVAPCPRARPAATSPRGCPGSP